MGTAPVSFSYGMRVRDRVNTLDAEDWQMDTGFRLTSFSTLPAGALTMACMVKPSVVQSPSVETSRAEAVMRSPFRVSTKRLDTALFAGTCTVYTIRYVPPRSSSMPSWVALKSSELLKVGFSVTESPLASSTGVPLAKDALAWQPSQPSQQSSQQQSQSQSQSSQQQLLQPQLLQESQPQPQPVLRRVAQLLQPQPQPVLRAVPQLLQPQLLQPQPQPVLLRVEQLLQPQLLHVLHPQPLRAVPQPLQPQLLQPQRSQGSQHSQQGLTGPQGPVKKGKLRLVQVPQRLNGPEMLRSTPKQLQPVRTVAQELQPQLLQELQLLQPVLRRVEQVLQPQL